MAVNCKGLTGLHSIKFGYKNIVKLYWVDKQSFLIICLGYLGLPYNMVSDQKAQVALLVMLISVFLFVLLPEMPNGCVEPQNLGYFF